MQKTPHFGFKKCFGLTANSLTPSSGAINYFQQIAFLPTHNASSKVRVIQFQPFLSKHFITYVWDSEKCILLLKPPESNVI